jgi:hypothetical protein
MIKDFIDSRGRGFTDLWPVAPDYQIKDGQICPRVDGQFIQWGTFHSFKGCQTYLPMTRIELPGELAKMARGRESDVLDFVRRYGLLGYARAWRIPEEVVGARLCEGGHAEAAPQLRGDPLPWVWAHAQTVQLVLDLMGRLDNSAALRAFMDTLKTQEDPGTYAYRVARRGYLHPMPILSRQRGERQRDTALHIIETILNLNLTGVSRVLLVEHQDKGQPGFTSLFEPRNLIDSAYWQLADAAIGGWVRRCANPRCASFFVAKSQKVKYCPPPIGHYTESDDRDLVSPCMNRRKQQTHRDLIRKRSKTSKGRARSRSKGKNKQVVRG